jgi:TolB-like protein/Flp pilus assembly protein TadD
MQTKRFPAYEGNDSYFFVSYDHKDSDVVSDEMAWIREAGVNLWYDDGIHVGAVWRRALAAALKSAEGVIYFCTKRSSNSDNCLKEINFALDDKKPVFVVQLDDAALPDELRLSLSDRQTLIRSAFDEETYRSRLLTALRSLNETKAPPASNAIVPTARSIPKMPMLTTGVALIIGAVAIYLLVSPGTPLVPGQAVRQEEPPEQHQYFVDGLTDEIITGLQKYNFLPVIARNSTFSYKGLNVSVEKVAKQLGAGYVLEGGVQKQGTRLRINAQLIDDKGIHVWAENYDGSTADVFAMQEDLTAQIVASAMPEVWLRESKRVDMVPPANFEAWDYVLKAQSRWPVESLEDLQDAEDLAHKALALDPTMGEAYMVLGGVYIIRATMFGLPFTEMTTQAITYAQKAKALDPFNVAVCSCLGQYLIQAGRIEEGMLEHETTLELNPSSAQAHGGYAWALHVSGRDREALEHNRLAMRLSPRSPSLYMSKLLEGISLLMLNDYEAAIRGIRQSISLQPSYATTHIYLIAAQYIAGDMPSARRALEQMNANHPNAPLSEILPEFGFERPFTSVLRTHLAKPGSNIDDSSTEYQVFGTMLENLGWQGVIPGTSE